MKTFEKNNSIYFECTYRDWNGGVTTPTSPTHKVVDSKGNEETSGIPSLKETGVYYFYWESSEEGTYVVEFRGSIGGQNGIARQLFKIVETKVS